MRINLTVNYTMDLPNCKLDTLMGAFLKLLQMFLKDFLMHCVGEFANHYMTLPVKPFSCSCGNSANFGWKTHNAGETEIDTPYGPVKLLQFQLRCGGCGKRIYVLRQMLGLEKRERTGGSTKKVIALLGSLTSFRVSEKIMDMFGAGLSRMKIWRCVQSVGGKIVFGVSENDKGVFEADGTGVPVQGIKNRGRELKVVVQHKKGGGVRVAGLDIGKYGGGWEGIFAPLKDSLASFKKRVLLITDGDTSILDGLGVKVLFQRCLWHIPYQMKYFLWKDAVKRKSELWFEVLGAVFDAASVRSLICDKDEIKAVVAEKRRKIGLLLERMEKKGLRHSHTCLKNALPDMFTALEKRFEGRTSSRAERVMKTVNMRVNVGKWSETGALNVSKVRLAHYYNDFDPAYTPAGEILRL